MVLEVAGSLPPAWERQTEFSVFKSLGREPVEGKSLLVSVLVKLNTYFLKNLGNEVTAAPPLALNMAK